MAEDGALLIHVMPQPRYIGLIPPAWYILFATAQNDSILSPLAPIASVCMRDFMESAG